MWLDRAHAPKHFKKQNDHASIEHGCREIAHSWGSLLPSAVGYVICIGWVFIAQGNRLPSATAALLANHKSNANNDKDQQHTTNSSDNGIARGWWGRWRWRRWRISTKAVQATRNTSSKQSAHGRSCCTLIHLLGDFDCSDWTAHSSVTQIHVDSNL